MGRATRNSTAAAKASPSVEKLPEEASQAGGETKSGIPLGKLKQKLEAEANKAENPTAVPSEESVVDKAPGNSMVVILTQGLMANDREKLDAVLLKTDLSIIQSTLAELPINHVVPLLKVIEDNLRLRRGIDIRPLLRWAQTILSMHMGYLSSIRSLETEIGGLYDWMKTRSNSAAKLLALHGKMCVLGEHIQKRTNSKLEPLARPIVIFRTDNIDTSDEEDASAAENSDGHSSGEEEWWNDEEKDDDDADMQEESGSGEESDDSDKGEIRKKNLAKQRPDTGDGPGAANDDDDEEDDEDEDEEMEED
ncbi:unnamed protein product, partial [Mesorhabditis spiculigera]